MDLAAKKIGKLAADRQAEFSAAILATGAGIGLLEGFENDALLINRDSNSRIGDFEGNNRRTDLEANGWVTIRPPPPQPADAPFPFR